MKGKRIALSCAVMALTIAGGAMANEIYKWTDEDGTVHYEDRPTGAANEERLAITYGRTDSSAVQKRVLARVDAMTARDEARSVAAAAEQEAADNAAIEADKAQRCDGARSRLESYLQSRRERAPSQRCAFSASAAACSAASCLAAVATDLASSRAILAST